MNEERNKYLTEAMGDCWHDEFIDHDKFCPYHRVSCAKCKAYIGDSIYYTKLDKESKHYSPYVFGNTNFSTPDGFFKLWNFAMEQKWWKCFCDWSWNIADCTGTETSYLVWLVNPDRFADAIYQYLKENNK